MTVEEARSRLRTQLEEQYGEMAASILLDRPPGGWTDLATKDDLAALEARVDRRFDQIDRRFKHIDRRFDQIDRRFEHIDRRFDDIDRRFGEFDAGIDLRITSAVSKAVASQTRWVFGAIIAVIPILAVIERI